MVEKFHARLTVITVVDLPVGGYWGMEGGYPIKYDLHAISEDAVAQLCTILGKSKSDVQARTSLTMLLRKVSI